MLVWDRMSLVVNKKSHGDFTSEPKALIYALHVFTDSLFVNSTLSGHFVPFIKKTACFKRVNRFFSDADGLKTPD
jgi:hypothetical protein